MKHNENYTKITIALDTLVEFTTDSDIDTAQIYSAMGKICRENGITSNDISCILNLDMLKNHRSIVILNDVYKLLRNNETINTIPSENIDNPVIFIIENWQGKYQSSGLFHYDKLSDMHRKLVNIALSDSMNMVNIFDRQSIDVIFSDFPETQITPSSKPDNMTYIGTVIFNNVENYDN